MDLGYHLGNVSVTVSVVLFHRTSQLRWLQLLFRLQSVLFLFPSHIYTLFIATSVTVMHLKIMLHIANTVEATWKHVNVSLCAYNHTVNYRFCLTEYMLRAVCSAHHLDPSQCSCMSSEVWTGCIASVHLQEHTPLCPSTVNTSSLCLLHPQLPHWHHVASSALVDQCYRRADGNNRSNKCNISGRKAPHIIPSDHNSNSDGSSMPNLQRGDT